ncbi:MAG TPA: nicotinate-nicotinamide nucleotide adenylyltransferase, partial [Candidatus Latescibacteria bacterium]|nr:nicotinate-nicotinamide nucleotide adenylyltransferase [Candidatus Latescibacterota bacterium]
MNPGRLGIYGGTFNPIHTGHLIIAQEIYEQCKLDRLLFIPS